MRSMVSDEQVRRLLKLRKREKTLATAAAKAGMDEKTARKWLGSEKLPSQRKIELPRLVVGREQDASGRHRARF